MKLSRTVSLAVAVSLVASTVSALAQISRAAPPGPIAKVHQGDQAPHEVPPPLRGDSYMDNHAIVPR
jgi:hypothetical protein